ncbi:MAG: DMT family transporter [Actinobacteria bacterium]|nr:DMT family transporter [Actinomycetota bacterium]
MQPPINAQLALRSAGLTAALISFAVGTVFLLILTLTTGSLTSVSLSGAPWWLFAGGLMGVGLVYAGLRLVPILGVAALTAATVAGQLAGGLLIDRLGLFGVTQIPLSTTRLFGVLLLIIGVVLVLRR